MEKNWKTHTHSSVFSSLIVYSQKSTFENLEDTAVSAAILWLAVCLWRHGTVQHAWPELLYFAFWVCPSLLFRTMETNIVLYILSLPFSTLQNDGNEYCALHFESAILCSSEQSKRILYFAFWVSLFLRFRTIEANNCNLHFKLSHPFSALQSDLNELLYFTFWVNLSQRYRTIETNYCTLHFESNFLYSSERSKKTLHFESNAVLKSIFRAIQLD